MAKFCMKCGASLEENVKFCKACGTPVGGTARNEEATQTIRMAQPQAEPTRRVKAPLRQSGNSSKVVIVAMALVIAALCGGGGYYYYQSHQTAAAENTSSKVETDDKSKDGQAKTNQTLPDGSTGNARAESAEYGVNTKTPSTNSVVSSNTELILGKIYIGQSKADALQIMGAPIKVSDPNNNGHKRYKYSDMEVVITGDVVTGFVSDTAAVSTKRGVKQGDALDKVMKEYGKPYSKSDYDGTTLYEYKFTSDLGQDCLLRFAMKNGVVDYISGRIL